MPQWILIKYQLTTKLLLRKVSDYYILKAKAPTAKPFADICSIEDSFHILESRTCLTSHVIATEKTLKLQRHIALVLDNKISTNSKRRLNHMHNVTYRFFEIRVTVKVMIRTRGLCVSAAVEAPKNLFFGLFSQVLKLRFTAMVTYSFHLYSRSSHHFIQCFIPFTG